VHALIGAYQSGITITTSAIAERYGIPFLTLAFLREQKAAGQKTATIAVVDENTEYGNSVASGIKEDFAKDGLNITQVIPYSANTTDVQPQVLQLK
jgi:branched-chain amino acid transport system substrate-binding protein